uniref:Putative secreted protein n=1 Tax=Ixodes ricinus TaxID=34613 RepID=A0A6B0U5M7_IXORI
MPSLQMTLLWLSAATVVAPCLSSTSGRSSTTALANLFASFLEVGARFVLSNRCEWARKFATIQPMMSPSWLWALSPR